MDYKELAQGMCELHFRNGKNLFDGIALGSVIGEERVLIYQWRCTAKRESVLSGDLSNELMLTSGRVANILKSLEKKRYIARRVQEKDRRWVQVLLTKEGKQYIEDFYERKVQGLADLLEQMGEEDAGEFVRLLRKIVLIMSTCKEQV